MAKIYYEKDADLKVLKNKTIAVIGYGSQGHAQAQNLRDSGLKVVVSELEGSPQWEKAKKDGMEVKSTSEASKMGEIIQILVPDEYQSSVYKNFIQGNLKKGKVLVFSHGFNIHFGQIIPPKDVDVIMVAPKGPGHLVRRLYTEGRGVPALIAVHQDSSKNAKKIALSHCHQGFQPF